MPVTSFRSGTGLPPVTPHVYPYLGWARDAKNIPFIVMFTSPGAGAVIWVEPGCIHKLGTYGTGWDQRAFVEWFGTITIEGNKQ